MATLTAAQTILRQGSTGPAVRELQAALNRVLKPTPPLDVDGAFGPMTRTAVMTLQTRKHLQVDGVAGPQTWAALSGPAAPGAPPPPPPAGGGTATGVVEQAVQIALTQNGVRESGGANRGPQVDAYNAASGAGNGALWCMSFVYWCFVQAAARTGQPNPMPRTAYCPFLYNWGRTNNKLVTAPQRGDIFLVKGLRDGQQSQIHTGLVTGGGINTIEGNTNNDGSSNGIGVFTRTRSVSSCYYVRL